MSCVAPGAGSCSTEGELRPMGRVGVRPLSCLPTSFKGMLVCGNWCWDWPHCHAAEQLLALGCLQGWASLTARSRLPACRNVAAACAVPGLQGAGPSQPGMRHAPLLHPSTRKAFHHTPRPELCCTMNFKSSTSSLGPPTLKLCWAPSPWPCCGQAKPQALNLEAELIMQGV